SHHSLTDKCNNLILSFPHCSSNLRSFKDGTVKKPYPPKILANQKSPASSGIQSEISRASHPVQHHASHGWIRRNRLRELRIRCVARKFLYLWIRMTFGRVFPSKARFYYEQRILRKVFEEWKEEWWVFQREWKLCVRADCHYRYHLYNLMFQTWRTYVHQQQEMRNKYLRAENHDAKQKMRQAWKSWLIYVVFRRTKLQMQTTALEFRQRSILWVWWSQWRQQLGQVRVGHALLASAVKHRVLSLQQQVSAAESGLVSSVHIFSPYTHRGGVGLPSRRLAIMRLPLSWALPAVKGAGQGAEGRSNREGWPQWREAAIRNMVNVITSGLHSASANPGAGKGFMN
uniref:SFI1 centrin binding protein n=1 Tax=Ursus americanus TaxID=9643 RepID=A0A452SI15_URSAM